MKKIILCLLTIVFIFQSYSAYAGEEVGKANILDYSCDIHRDKQNEFPTDWNKTYTAVAQTKYNFDGEQSLYGGIRISDGSYDIVYNGTIIGNHEKVHSYGFAEFGNHYYYITTKDGKESLYINGVLRGSYKKIVEVSFGFVNGTYLAKVENENGKYQVISDDKESEEYLFVDLMMINYSGTSTLFTATKDGKGKFVYVKDGVESTEYESIYPVFGGESGDEFLYIFKEDEKWFYNLEGVLSPSFNSFTELIKSKTIKPYTLLIRDSFNLNFYLEGKKSKAFAGLYDIYFYENFLYFAGADNFNYFCTKDVYKETEISLRKQQATLRIEMNKAGKYNKYISIIDNYIQNADIEKLSQTLTLIENKKDAINKSSLKEVFQYLAIGITIRIIAEDTK